MASRSPIPTGGWRTTTPPRPRRGSRRRTRSPSAISTASRTGRAMATRLRALNDYERYSAPSRKAQYVFFRKNDGLQDQSVLYVQKGFEGTPEVLIDPNAWGTKTSPVPLTTFSPSKDAKYAVSASRRADRTGRSTTSSSSPRRRRSTTRCSGSRCRTSRGRATGSSTAAIRRPIRRRPRRASTRTIRCSSTRSGRRSRRISWSTPIRPIPSASTSWRRPTTSGSRSCRCRSAARARTATRCSSAISAAGDKDFKPLIADITNDSFYVVDSVGDKLLVATNKAAPNMRVVLIDPKQPAEANWKVVLRERPEPLDGASTAGGKLFATYIKDVTTRAYVHALDGRLENEIVLPGLGTATGFGGERDSTFVFFTFNSLNVPPTIYRYDLAAKKTSVFRQPKVPGYDPAAYETKQVFYTSKDGTQGADVPRPSQGPEAGRHQPDAALRLRRLQRGAVADLQRVAPGAARTGLRLRLGEHARRRRVRREVAPGGHEAEEAERLRRLHRRRRVADRQQVHLVAAAGDSGRIERRAARRRGDEPAARAVPRRHSAGRRHGHAALPQVHDRLELGGRLRLERRCRRVRGVEGVLAAAQHQAGRQVSGDAGHDRGSRRSRGAGAFVQVRGDLAGAGEPRQSAADPHRDQLGSRRQRPGQAARHRRRHLLVHHVQHGRDAGVPGAQTAPSGQ